MNSAAEAGRRLSEGFGDGRFYTNNGKWKLFVVVVTALLASLAVESNASERIGEWEILTRQNFSSQIRLHPHILLLVTLPCKFSIIPCVCFCGRSNQHGVLLS